MNDFINEELRILLLWGMDRADSVGIENFKSEGHIHLYNKIESMLEDCCEHEYKKTIHKSGMYFIALCSHCHRTIPYYKCGHCSNAENSDE
jgi:hypothetical protein